MIRNSIIIPCAGDFQNSNSGFVNYSSNAMLPLNGKPVISWIIDSLLDKNIHEIVIVCRKEDVELNNFLKWAYSNIKIVHVEKETSKTILESIYSGLRSIEISSNHTIGILLGDTLIFDHFDLSLDYLFAGYKNDAKKWCFLEVDSQNYLANLFDEVRNENVEMLVAAGYYNFVHGLEFMNKLIECITLNEFELSDVIKKYATCFPYFVKVADSWYDLGHIEGILNSKRKLINSRSFNSLEINPVLNTITKKSQNNEKLRDELNWYKLMPEELKVLSPRLLSTNTNETTVTIVQEFYGYPTLAELFLYGRISKSIWSEIYRHLFVLNSEFRKYTTDNVGISYGEFYINKTLDRIDQLSRQPEFIDLLKYDFILINGREYKNLPILWDAFKEKLTGINQFNNESHIIHGDFCFSNILFDVNSFIIKLIDPRGSFGVKGIYGDSRYEIAKLRHSAIGKYDFIVSNLYKISINENVINYEIATNENSLIAEEIFDSFVINHNYNLEEIKLIETSLFISMLPMHSDNYNRQLMLYVTGILKLNEIL
jgi:dTDP-glucose pyrophosphorylase